MGILDDFEIDMTDIKEAGDWNVDDGIYEFNLLDVFLKKGTDKHPDTVWVIFKYGLDDDGTEYQEWFTMPEDPQSPTVKEKQKLGFYKQRLLSLGVAPEDVNTVNSDDLIGTTGVLQLKTTKGKDGKDYQNVDNRSFKLGIGSDRDDYDGTPDVPVKPKRTRKPAAPAPAAEEAETAEDEPAAPAKPARKAPVAAETAVDNPFA